MPGTAERFAREVSGVRTLIGATIAAVLAALCVACTQPPVKPPPGIQDKIDRDARCPGTDQHAYNWDAPVAWSLLS